MGVRLDANEIELMPQWRSSSQRNHSAIISRPSDVEPHVQQLSPVTSNRPLLPKILSIPSGAPGMPPSSQVKEGLQRTHLPSSESLHAMDDDKKMNVTGKGEMEKGKGGYSVVATAQHRLMQKMMMDSSPGISRDKEHHHHHHHQSNHTNQDQNMDQDNYNNNQYPHNYNDNNNQWDRRLQALATTHTKPSHQIIPSRGGGLHHHPHPDGQSSLSRSSLRSSSLKSKSSSLKSARMSSISGRFDEHILLYTSCRTHHVVHILLLHTHV